MERLGATAQDKQVYAGSPLPPAALHHRRYYVFAFYLACVQGKAAERVGLSTGVHFPATVVNQHPKNTYGAQMPALFIKRFKGNLSSLWQRAKSLKRK